MKTVVIIVYCSGLSQNNKSSPGISSRKGFNAGDWVIIKLLQRLAEGRPENATTGPQPLVFRLKKLQELLKNTDTDNHCPWR